MIKEKSNNKTYPSLESYNYLIDDVDICFLYEKPPELDDEDEAILDRVWAKIASNDREKEQQ